MSQCHTLVESVTSVVVQRTDCDRAPVIAPVTRSDVVLETAKPISVVTFGGIPGRQGPEGPPGPPGAGDMNANVYDPQEIEADAFDRSNHTGTQSLATISDAGTAAFADAGDFATAAQGANADTAYGWGDHANAGYATQSWVQSQGYKTTDTTYDEVSEANIKNPSSSSAGLISGRRFNAGLVSWAQTGYSTTTTDYPNLVVDSGGNIKRSTKTFGTASEATLTTSNSDTTAGRALKVGDFGLGGSSPTINPDSPLGFGSWISNSESTNSDLNGVGLIGITVPRTDRNIGWQMWTAAGGGASQNIVTKLYVRKTSGAAGNWGPSVNLYHTGNTTVGTGGELLAASPIVKLSSDGIKTEGFANHGSPVFTRKSTGVYEITGTSGLRVADGWYINSPENRNGEKYFNLDWEQDKEPTSENGILKEPEPVTLTIKTFERVWNPQTGRFDNGNPVDIPDGRWIDLRFNEIEQPEEDEE